MYDLLLCSEQSRHIQIHAYTVTVIAIPHAKVTNHPEQLRTHLVIYMYRSNHLFTA